MTDLFKTLGDITNPKKQSDFTSIAMPKGYVLETFINGNKTHAAEYCKEIISTGKSGYLHIIDELAEIKTINPEIYTFIYNKLSKLI